LRAFPSLKAEGKPLFENAQWNFIEIGRKCQILIFQDYDCLPLFFAIFLNISYLTDLPVSFL